MVKIVYTNYSFRNIVAKYIDSHLCYKKDIGFIEIMNLFEKEETVIFSLTLLGDSGYNGRQTIQVSSSYNSEDSHIIYFSNSPFCSKYLNNLMKLKRMWTENKE